MDRSLCQKGIFVITGALVGVAMSRLLFDAFFPVMAWAGRPLGVIFFALIGGGIAFTLHKKVIWWHILPLWLNVIWIIRPEVDLVGSRVLFFGTIWLSGYITAVYSNDDEPNRWWQRPWFWILLALIPIYGLTLGRTVGTNDTFEFGS